MGRSEAIEELVRSLPPRGALLRWARENPPPRSWFDEEDDLLEAGAPMTIDLKLGDCLALMRGMPDASIDAIVTDPPAGISFMSANFDSFKSRAHFVEFLTPRLAECLRLAKPGAHALVWALPRTSHWTATAVEDAGWDIRDVVTSITGQGFPKSLDIAKAFEALGESALAEQWKGWGTALKPSAEHWILARKPFAGNVASNVREHGTAGLNIAACKVPTGDDLNGGAYAKDGSPRHDGTKNWRFERDGGAGEFVAPSGRYPPNLVLTHHPGCVPCGTRRVKSNGRPNCDGRLYAEERNIYRGHEPRPHRPVGDPDGMETVPAWRCVEGLCPVAELDRQSGERKSGEIPAIRQGIGYAKNCGRENSGTEGKRSVLDSGGASRFYPQFAWEADDFAPFLYCAKASRADRGEGNHHPTVKSTSLCAWLARLICPRDGIILDPFMGSGSTLVAAIREGFGVIGIESDPDYFAIAERRIHAERAKTPLLNAGGS